MKGITKCSMAKLFPHALRWYWCKVRDFHSSPSLW